MSFRENALKMERTGRMFIEIKLGFFLIGFVFGLVGMMIGTVLVADRKRKKEEKQNELVGKD